MKATILKNTVLLLALSLSSSLFAAPSVILKTVGQVGDEVITSRTVQISAAIEQALFKKKGGVTVPAINTLAFKKEVSATLLETTVYLESRNFKLSEVSDSDIQKAVNSAQARLVSLNDWKFLEVQGSELRETVKRKLKAKKFIRFKADSSVVPVTNTEAKDYFEKNRMKFGDLPFENFKENIKAYLSRQQVEQRLRDWFEVLQNKYSVKNALSDI